MNAAIQRLRAEIASDFASFDEHIQNLKSVKLTDDASPGDLAQAAIFLHHAYCAIESLLVRLFFWFEGDKPHGPDWHQNLLHTAALEIPAIRPALISIDSRNKLHRILGFRHFFRHAYAVNLEAGQLADLQTVAISLHPLLQNDCNKIDRLLEKLTSQLK